MKDEKTIMSTWAARGDQIAQGIALKAQMNRSKIEADPDRHAARAGGMARAVAAAEAQRREELRRDAAVEALLAMRGKVDLHDYGDAATFIGVVMAAGLLVTAA